MRALGSCYTHRYALNAVEATYQAEAEQDPADVSLIFEDAGRIPDEHGDFHKGVIKVLKSEFSDCPPEGATFTLQGTEWVVLRHLGKADGTNSHQWAVLVGAEKRFQIKGKA